MPNLEQSDVIRGEVAEDVQLGPFCVVAEGARVGAGTRLGAHVVVHPGTSIGESCEVQDDVVLGKPPKLARHSSAAGAPIEPLVIDNNAVVGAGAIVGAFVAAGAVVTSDVPARGVVMAVPGRLVRDVPEADLIERWR
jgi:acetyltransferase-like isoleucine patch superfamily enzyme